MRIRKFKPDKVVNEFRVHQGIEVVGGLYQTSFTVYLVLEMPEKGQLLLYEVKGPFREQSKRKSQVETCRKSKLQRRRFHEKNALSFARLWYNFFFPI